MAPGIGIGLDIDATAPTPNFFVILAFYLQPEAHKFLRLTYDKNTTLNSRPTHHAVTVINIQTLMANTHKAVAAFPRVMSQSKNFRSRFEVRTLAGRRRRQLTELFGVARAHTRPVRARNSGAGGGRRPAPALSNNLSYGCSQLRPPATRSKSSF